MGLNPRQRDASGTACVLRTAMPPIHSIRVLLCVALAAAAAHAREAQSLAELLPPGAPLYFEARMPTLEENRIQATMRCFEEPSLKRVLDRIADAEDSFTSVSLPFRRGRLLLQTDVRQPSMLMTVRWLDEKGERRFRMQNRAAIGWIGLSEGPMPVDLVAAIDIDPDAESAIATLQRMIAAASLHLRGEAEGSIEQEIERVFVSEAHRERRYVTGTLRGVPFHLVPLGRLLVLATSAERVRDMIDRTIDEGRPSLATDPRHLEILAARAGSGTVTMLIEAHVDRALEVLKARFPAESAAAAMGLAQAGLGRLKGFSSVTRADGAGLSSTTSVLIDGERTGLGRLFAGGEPVKFDALSFAPQDSYYVTCGRLDLAQLYQATLDVGGMLVAMRAAAFEKQTGMRLREDLFDLAGPDAALIVAPSRGLIPDVGLVLGSNDPARLEASLLKLLGMVDWPPGTGPRSVQIGGVTAHVLPLGHRRLGGVPLAPTFGVVGGKLLVAPFPLTFQHLVAVNRGDYPDLTANRDFASLRARVPEDALALSYLDLARLVSLVYDTMMPVLQGMVAEGPQAPPLYELPDARVLERHLFGRIGWTRADARGLHWEAYSSMDMSGFAIGAVAAAATTFTLLRAPAPRGEVEAPAGADGPEDKRQRDREASLCEARARLLRGGLRIWRDEHKAFPEALGALREQQVAEENFTVPGADKPYVYLGPEGTGGVLLHGYANGLDNRICVVTTDLVLRRLTEAELEALLRREPDRGDR